MNAVWHKPQIFRAGNAPRLAHRRSSQHGGWQDRSPHVPVPRLCPAVPVRQPPDHPALRQLGPRNAPLPRPGRERLVASIGPVIAGLLMAHDLRDPVLAPNRLENLAHLPHADHKWRAKLTQRLTQSANAFGQKPVLPPGRVIELPIRRLDHEKRQNSRLTSRRMSKRGVIVNAQIALEPKKCYGRHARRPMATPVPFNAPRPA